jgi:hypothetical protein
VCRVGESALGRAAMPTGLGASRRHLEPCSLWKQWTLKQRLIAGIENVPAGKMPIFFTLTFPLATAPDEDEAHRAWRSLVARLRYRGYLGEYGWVLQRQKQGTLHFHGIAHLPWFSDGLAEWRQLILKSGLAYRTSSCGPPLRAPQGICGATATAERALAATRRPTKRLALSRGACKPQRHSQTPRFNYPRYVAFRTCIIWL